MLRTLDEKHGIGVYSRYMLEELVKIDRGHEYVLYYRSGEHLGKFADYAQVQEKVIDFSHNLFWDQIGVPLSARAADVDILFHTKFTVPLFTTRKTVMRLAGAGWFVTPEVYKNKVDLFYIKAMMPVYCKKADLLIANSQRTADDFIKILGVPRKKLRVIYNGIHSRFRPIKDKRILAKVREKYQLPERFMLTVGRYGPRKNFPTIYEALLQSRRPAEMKLVAVGHNTCQYREESRFAGQMLEDNVVFPGYVGHDDLPAFYNLAELFVFPSLYEEFGNPLVEAMACGCPIVASKTGAMPEVTAGAALYSDPHDVTEIARNIDRILHEDGLRQELVEKGLERAKEFSYRVVAARTLDVLEEAQ